MIENQIVYVLSNPAMPGIVKIGKTTQRDVELRMTQLYASGVPLPFKCEYAVEVEDCDKAEQALHIAFEPYRVNPKREFFDIAAEQAIAILKLLGTKNMTPNVEDELNKNVSKAEKDSAKRVTKRPSINYIEMGLSIGDKLYYVEDESIEVEVVSEKKVKYHDEIMGLTKATRLIKKLDYDIQPTRYWLYNGRSLKDIWLDTYASEDA
ncbi:MAG: GIY-YIG nuclease family protein [Epsilonproteobacteria bacterium]|nr:GIY-YIG nuclease family protein [Campylobacterota bacterium]